MEHVTWKDVWDRAEFRGVWVALSARSFDAAGSYTGDAEVVDADDDLVELCQRLRDSRSRNCAIVLCGTGADARGGHHAPAQPAVWS